MALVNTLKKSQTTLTCADLLRQFIQTCMVLSRRHGQVRVLMDTYVPGSLKEQTRLKRSGPDPIRYQVKDDTCIRKVSLRTFLSHTGTKQELTGYLCEGLVNTVPSSEKVIVVDFDGKTLTNTPGLVEFSQTGHEEADTLIPLHVLDVCRHDPAPPRIDIYCKDTDVYTLLLHLVATQEITSEVWMLAGTADKSKDICLNHHVASLGKGKAEAVLGLHAFTGGDWGGKFSGVTKDRWTQRFLELDEESDVISALQNLGSDPMIMSNEDDLALESFVCHVYDKSGKFTSTDKLRWESYQTKGSEGENLPPTRGAPVQHFRRTWLAAVIGKSYTTPTPAIPPPEDNGWYKEEEMLRPVTSLILPAPDSIIELVKCACKGDCYTRTGCSCKKNSLPCSPMCRCTEEICKNKPPRTDEFNDISESDDEEF